MIPVLPLQYFTFVVFSLVRPLIYAAAADYASRKYVRVLALRFFPKMCGKCSPAAHLMRIAGSALSISAKFMGLPPPSPRL